MSETDRTNDQDSGDMRNVRLLRVPLRLAARSAEHHATLMRELALVAAADDTSTAPGRLLSLAPELRTKYALLGQAQRARAVEAAATGAASIDLEYEAPIELADDAARVAALLAEVDQFCRDGELVTLVTPHDVAGYRAWVFAEFRAQLRGGTEPTPWTGSVDEPAQDSADSVLRPGTIVLDEDLDLEGAARARDAITAALEQGVTDLVIDVGGCDFVDSVGISLLLTTLARLGDCGGSLTLTNSSAAVRRTLHHAGILGLLVSD